MKKYPEINRKTIWNFRQNNPELVIQDAREYLGLSGKQLKTLRKILLARGINKWLKARRDLIAYKTILKIQIKEAINKIVECKKERKWGEYRGWKSRLKTLEDVRKNLRRICHQDRLVIWPESISRRALRKMNSIRVGVEIN